MSEIHPTALIGKNVHIGARNRIGPYVVIEDGVKLGSDNIVMSGAQLCRGTEIGDSNEIHMHAIIGHAPQDTAYDGASTKTIIDHRNIIREFVTIHRGTKEGTATIIGSGNFIMAYCHIAHNCVIGHEVTMVNQASLTGHCVVEDKAFLSGMTGFHQFSVIGKLSIVSALSACNKDIPPYMIAGGRPAVVLGINVVGLRRAGIKPEVRDEIKRSYKLLYRSGLNVSQAVAEMKRQCTSPEVQHLIFFIENSERGILDGAGEETLKPRKSLV